MSHSGRLGSLRASEQLGRAVLALFYLAIASHCKVDDLLDLLDGVLSSSPFSIGQRGRKVWMKRKE